MAIEITDKAVEEVRRRMNKEGIQAAGMRVGVKGGGCSGLSYNLTFETQARTGDKVFEREDVKLFVLPGNHDLVRPAEPQPALETRLRDRFLDLYLHLQMQKVIGDRLRPAGAKDPHGVEQARAQIRKSYDLFETQLTGSEWAMGPEFGLVDCAAAPPLFYCSRIEPLGERSKLAAYFERLKARRSFARVLKEAEPYFAMFPKE